MVEPGRDAMLPESYSRRCCLLCFLLISLGVFLVQFSMSELIFALQQLISKVVRSSFEQFAFHIIFFQKIRMLVNKI